MAIDEMVYDNLNYSPFNSVWDNIGKAYYNLWEQGKREASRLYKKATNINWKRVGKYVGLGTTGAVAGWTAGHFFGKDIADLIGVESKFMGMERYVAALQIKYLSTLVGGLIGIGVAYMHDRHKK